MEITTSIILAATAVVSIIFGLGIGFFLRKKIVEANTRAADQTSEAVISAGKKEAVRIKKDAELEARDIIFQGKTAFEKETKERRKELQALERRVESREEGLVKKYENLEKKESDLSRRERALGGQEKRLKEKETELNSVIAN